MIGQLCWGEAAQYMGNVGKSGGGGGGGGEPGQAGQLHTVTERYFVLKVSHTLRLACTCTHTRTHMHVHSHTYAHVVVFSDTSII